MRGRRHQPANRRGGNMLMDVDGQAFGRTDMLDFMSLMNDRRTTAFNDLRKSNFELREIQKAGRAAKLLALASWTLHDPGVSYDFLVFPTACFLWILVVSCGLPASWSIPTCCLRRVA